MEEVTLSNRSWRNRFSKSPTSSGHMTVDDVEVSERAMKSSSSRRRRRFSNPFESSSKRSAEKFDTTSQGSGSQHSGGNLSTSNRRGRRRRDRHASMDTSRSDIVLSKKDDSGDLSSSPGKTQQQQHLSAEGKQKSLLMRFLARTSTRRSQTSGGSTISRLTDDSDGEPQVQPRRATMDDMDLAAGDCDDSATAPAVAPKHERNRRSRRATIDFGISVAARRLSSGNLFSSKTNSSSNNSNSSSFSMSSVSSSKAKGEDYPSQQTKLQKKADDLHKGGQLTEAIDVWVESLELAEEHKDTLAAKMETICILVDLHLQTAQQQQEGIETLETFMDQEDAQRQVRYHRKTAKRYVHRLKPAIVKSTWLGPPNTYQMEFFCESEAWELALLVAEKMVQEESQYSSRQLSVTPQQLATIHFQIASQKLDRNRQGEALQHLQATVEQLKKLSTEERDMTMYMQVLQLLATEYNSQQQYRLALDAYEQQLDHAPSYRQASLYCQIARIYISMEQLDEALEKLDLAAIHMESAATSSQSSSVRFELLQTKGDVYYRLGRMEESLKVYEEALAEATEINPAETAKLLYTLGRLCVRLRRIRPAISYYSRELEITIQELGMNHMSVSRILHEIAKLYDEGLGEPKTALMKLNRALSVELAVLQECHLEVSTKCQQCNPVTHRMCTRHAQVQHDVSAQIRETKKSQGRIHFKLGNFDRAFKTSFDEKANVGGGGYRS